MLNMVTKLSKEANSPRPIGENQQYCEAAEKLARFRRQLHELRAAIDRENQSWYARRQTADDDAIGRADRMLGGETLEADLDTAAKVRGLEQKIEILRPAIVKQSELLDNIRGELSLEAGKTVQAKHRKALASILEAARALAAAANAERKIRGELIGHGYEVVERFTPAPRFATPLILGDENLVDSALGHFKQQLRDLRIEP